MLAPREDSKPRPKRPTRAQRNRSSRTKTATKDRKPNKKPTTLDDVRTKVRELSESGELLLSKLFDDASINALVEEILPKRASRDRVYTIPVTVSLFVQQVLSNKCGCKKVVTLLNKRRKAEELAAVSTNATSYCGARMRIPLALLEKLSRQTARVASDQLPESWRWSGRRVLLVDGLVSDAPDTPENQEKYPQPSSQKAGLGFPQIRVCAAICLTTGVTTDVQYAPVEGSKTGEATLFRRMFDDFEPGDIVVADSNFESYRDLATLANSKGVHMVCNINGSRTSPFSGRCKSIEDKTVTLQRPKFNASRFTQEEWEQLPETMDVRMIRYKVKGRNSELTIVTTLLDTETYTAKSIAELYKHRWECELDIRSIKTVMGMDRLSCHTPEMLERELMTYFLAYNLIRVTMCDAARIAGCMPRALSFKNAKDSWLKLGQDGCGTNDIAWLLWAILDSPLRKRKRPNEPRKVKRRNAKYERMKLPRDQEKQALWP